MGWATFWATFSQNHLVTLILNFNTFFIDSDSNAQGHSWRYKFLQRWRCSS
jgi:hypothetical protein